MIARLFALATLGVGGIIVADVLIHPKGTKTVLSGLASIQKVAGNQMLGYKAN